MNGNGNGFTGMGGNGNRNSPSRTPLVKTDRNNLRTSHLHNSHHLLLLQLNSVDCAQNNQRYLVTS